jgi:pullulanase/glycogen debranching enzyme
MEIWPGRPFPLGASWDGQGTNFAIFSECADGVELCLFDDEDRETRVALTERTAFNWHCYLPGVRPGTRYGYRVRGTYDPASGHRFNPAKLLIDPYAKSIDRGGHRGPRARRRGLRARRPEVGRHRPELRLGGRPAAEHAVGRDGDLRDPRQGLHGDT